MLIWKKSPADFLRDQGKPSGIRSGFQFLRNWINVKNVLCYWSDKLLNMRISYLVFVVHT